MQVLAGQRVQRQFRHVAAVCLRSAWTAELAAAAADARRRCRDAGVRPSMGSVGDAYDNAMCESFFATLECELLARSRFKTQAEARNATFAFIEGFYNKRRRHSSIGYLSPIDYERRHHAMAIDPDAHQGRVPRSGVGAVGK